MFLVDLHRDALSVVHDLSGRSSEALLWGRPTLGIPLYRTWKKKLPPPQIGHCCSYQMLLMLLFLKTTAAEVNSLAIVSSLAKAAIRSKIQNGLTFFDRSYSGLKYMKTTIKTKLPFSISISDVKELTSCYRSQNPSGSDFVRAPRAVMELLCRSMVTSMRSMPWRGFLAVNQHPPHHFFTMSYHFTTTKLDSHQ